MQACLQGMRSFVASNLMTADPKEASVNQETWGRYPDDKPVRPPSPQSDKNDDIHPIHSGTDLISPQRNKKQVNHPIR